MFNRQKTSFHTTYAFRLFGRDFVVAVINLKKVAEYGADNANVITQRETGQAPSRNHAVLNDFMVYCQENPSERFWQALRNWSGYNFIYGSKTLIENQDLQDTFYKEGK